MLGILLVVMAVSVAAIVISGYLLGGHRAKSVADLAALSGAAAVLSGGDGCAAARALAARQAVAVTACDQVGDQIDFVVTVRATVRVANVPPGLPRSISAVGHAGPTGTGG